MGPHGCLKMPSVFICYASEDKVLAEVIQLSLLGEGYQVFFDEQSLPPGADYQAMIKAAIYQCNVFVFIGSPASIAQGRFTLTELKLARERWPSPVNRVLPVVTSGVTPKDLPLYLQAATVMNVSGNAAFEVRSAVARMIRTQRHKHPRRLALTIAIGSIAFTLSIAITQNMLLTGVDSPIDNIPAPSIGDTAKPTPKHACRKPLQEIDSDSLARVLSRSMPLSARHQLGYVVVTPGVTEGLSQSILHDLLDRNAAGDWGDLDAEDKVKNDLASEKHAGQRFSCYALNAVTNTGVNLYVWIITDYPGDLSKDPITWVMFPHDLQAE